MSEAAAPRRLARKAAHLLSRALLVLAVAYACITLGVVLFATQMIFPAPKDDPTPLVAGAHVLTLTSADGVPVHALVFDPPSDDAPIVVQFHGNGELVGIDQWIGGDLEKLGFGAVLVEYRGYGRSSSVGPTERGIYADSSAILDHLRASGLPDSRIALWGFSLGTGVAAEMASRGYGSHLILQAPFTSIPDMAMLKFPYLPARWLTPVDFDTLAKAPRIHMPTLVFHGDADPVIPFEFGKRVAQAIPGATFVPVAKGSHDYRYGRRGWVFEQIAAFVRGGG